MSGNGGDDGGGGFGGGGGTPSFDCSRVSIKTNITSPNPVVLVSVRKDDVLRVGLQTATGPLVAITDTNEILGPIFTRDPASLIDCINQGYNYQAKILSINGGDVQILITNT